MIRKHSLNGNEFNMQASKVVIVAEHLKSNPQLINYLESKLTKSNRIGVSSHLRPMLLVIYLCVRVF